MLASEVIDLSAVLLNDAAKTLYTNTVQIPFLKAALRDLQTALEDQGIPRVKKRAAPQTIVGGALVLTTVPTDMLQPITLWEKGVNETDDYYIEIIPKAWNPLTRQSNILGYYDWREEVVHFIGATQSRVVLLDYYQVLTEIVNETSTLLLNNALNFLAFRTAYIIASSIGGSAMAGRAATLKSESDYALDKYLAVRVKGQQALPVRNSGYGD